VVAGSRQRARRRGPHAYAGQRRAGGRGADDGAGDGPVASQHHVDAGRGRACAHGHRRGAGPGGPAVPLGCERQGAVDAADWIEMDLVAAGNQTADGVRTAPASDRVTGLAASGQRKRGHAYPLPRRGRGWAARHSTRDRPGKLHREVRAAHGPGGVHPDPPRAYLSGVAVPPAAGEVQPVAAGGQVPDRVVAAGVATVTAKYGRREGCDADAGNRHARCPRGDPAGYRSGAGPYQERVDVPGDVPGPDRNRVRRRRAGLAWVPLGRAAAAAVLEFDPVAAGSQTADPVADSKAGRERAGLRGLGRAGGEVCRDDAGERERPAGGRADLPADRPAPRQRRVDAGDRGSGRDVEQPGATESGRGPVPPAGPARAGAAWKENDLALAGRQVADLVDAVPGLPV